MRMPETLEPAPEALSRRRFYLAAMYIIWAVMGIALAIPAAVYLLFPPLSRKADEWVEATTLNQLENGVPEEAVFRKNRVDGWKVSSEKTSAWVVKKSDTEVVAFAPQCTHLGCAYRWEETKKSFLCPCHTSVFSMEGKVLSGPAPRPLDRYDSKVENNKLMVGEIHISPEQAG